MRIKGRRISKGVATGEALVTSERISFLGGLDPKSGIVIDEEHPLYGECVRDKVLVFPGGKGSTVGSYVLYLMKKYGTAPAAMVNVRSDVIVAVGAIIAEIPLVDALEKDPFKVIRSGQVVLVNGTEGYIEIKASEKL
ncbi:MAG: Mevalonate 5-phosphate dehydratase subunit 2 [Candidatus Alkanophagales archaeon MCA70_species_1]|nr:Mevalonate 5-phosphate dehydratase subunit 2 [Candidatus Alkanophaga volatiphilum]